MAELLSMGELLIDFTPTGKTEDSRQLFARNPGGAPANVAVQAVRSGISAGFLGRVGKDSFGDFLLSTLKDCGVDTSGLSQDPEFATTLAFVQLNEQGDRDFSFYRNPGADTRLTCDEKALALVDGCKLLCFGSLLLTTEPSRSAVHRLADHAKARGKLTAYDPNWRPPLWKDREEGIRQMQSLVSKADIMKVSEEELFLITGEKELSAGMNCLISQGVSLAAVTLGPKGCIARTPGLQISRSTYDTKVADTTGSGDSFFGALLARLIQCGKRPEELSGEELSDFLDFANAAGAVCAEKQGAIPALPELSAIEECRRTVPLLK